VDIDCAFGGVKHTAISLVVLPSPHIVGNLISMGVRLKRPSPWTKGDMILLRLASIMFRYFICGPRAEALQFLN
jgi:hypothetical protein